MGNDQALVDQVEAAGDATDEPVWQLPLEQRYRKRARLDRSPTCGTWAGANGGAITPALFLAEFVGDIPLAHIDIAGTAQTTGDTGWHTAGCSGFGARLLLAVRARLRSEDTDEPKRSPSAPDEPRAAPSGCSTGSRRSATRSRTR